MIRGNEQQLLLLVRGLRARGHDVVASAVGGSATYDGLAEAGAAVTAVRPRGDADVVSLLRFVAWLRRTRADALLGTSWKRAFIVLLAGRIARVPVVFRLGGPHPHRGRVSDRLRAHALSHWADACYVNSTELRTQLLSYAPHLAAERVSVIPNGVQIIEVSPAPLREQIGATPDERLIVSAGGLEHNKGYDVLVRAFAALRGVPARLVIAGAGPELNALRELASSLDVAARVHFLGHRADVPSVLRAGDAFALTSRADSTPNAVLEAMAAGLPVVTTNVAGMQDLLGARADHPAAGWIAPIDDAETVARALHAALTGAEGHPRGQEAKRRVLHEHAPQSTIVTVEALLRSSAR